MNDALHTSVPLALGDVEGPEDVALDRDGNLYSGSRHGNIHRWLAPDYTEHEVFAHIGGGTYGMNFDRDGNLVVCVGGMGLYMVTPEREVVKLTDETNRTPFKVIDDSRLRLADDLDIAPDGRIFFSEATYRYSAHDWQVDMLESRGNGRLICYDPRDGSTRKRISTTASSRTGSSACPMASRCCSTRPGPAGSAATGSTARTRARSNRSSRTCRAIPTTSTALRTATTGSA